MNPRATKAFLIHYVLFRVIGLLEPVRATVSQRRVHQVASLWQGTQKLQHPHFKLTNKLVKHAFGLLEEGRMIRKTIHASTGRICTPKDSSWDLNQASHCEARVLITAPSCSPLLSSLLTNALWGRKVSTSGLVSCGEENIF